MTEIFRPTSVGHHGHPFAMPLAELKPLGYECEEFFVRGEARRYDLVGERSFDGRWLTKTAESTPFTTRMMVVAPSSPSRFNGTVLVDWINVSAGFEIAAFDHVGMYEQGFACVMVSAQQLGVTGHTRDPQGLRAWDRERYAELSLPAASYSFDVFTQVARTVAANRPGTGIDPLRGLDVRKLVAIGSSQSAAWLATYLNAVQPIERCFDAALLSVYFGFGAPLDDDVPWGGRSPKGGMHAPPRTSHHIRSDLDIPVFVVNSEPVLMAAYQHLQGWMHDGVAPPCQPMIDVAGDPPTIVRDALGLAVGGIRLPAIDVPTGDHRGDTSIAGVGNLGGSTIDFDADTLRSLYPDHRTYVAQVAAAVTRSLDAQVMLAANGEQMIAEAKSAAMPPL